MDWVERFPGRLEHELADFERLGLSFAVDERLREEQGRIALRGAIEVEGERDPVQLVVVYPASYPFFRPEVYAPDLSLTRHQNPFERNLCLLDRSTRAWNPSETAAQLVATQVPYLLGLLREGGQTMLDAEAPQGEPISLYFPTLAGSVVFIADEMLHLPGDRRFGFGRIAVRASEQPLLRVRGLLKSVATRERKGKIRPLAQASPELTARFGGAEVGVRWVRLDSPPTSRSEEEILREVEAATPGLPDARWERVADGEIAVTGLVFEEEVEQGVIGDTWLFVVAVRKPPVRGVVETGFYTARGERLSRADLTARVPASAALAEKRVAQVGLGALGAPTAFELGRAQLGELRVLDFDTVEAGTIVRWPYGVSAIGAPKVDFVSQVLPHEYPFTEIKPFQHRLGEAPPVTQEEVGESDFDVLGRMFDGVDLVIDASAEIAIQQLTAHLADERGVPQLTVWATEGAQGGVVARVIPGETGCWHCLQHALNDGVIPIPPHDETGTVQPRGCGSRTFTGASFDLLPIVAQAVRTATTALLHGRRGADVFVLSMTGEDGAPHWTSHRLERRAGCPGCGVAVAA
jgi:molybdopterin/thiamine biosynthesis adenylyltransferase